MSEKRPLFRLSIKDLEAKYRASKNDIRALNSLLTELKHRETARATDLRTKVETSISKVNVTKDRALIEPHAEKPTQLKTESSNATQSHQNDEAPHVALVDTDNQPIDQVHSMPQRTIDLNVASGIDSQKENKSIVSKSLAEKKQKLTRILQYTKDLFLLSRRPVLDIDNERSYRPCFHEKDLVGLQGFSVNVDMDIWFQLSRVKETNAPSPGTMFDGWIAPQRHSSPDNPPTLLNKRVVRITVAEVDKLRDSGVIPDPSSVLDLPPSDRNDPNLRDVILFLKDQDSIKSAWSNYLGGPWAQWAEEERPRRRSIAVYNQLFTAYQKIQSMGADTPVELVLGLGIARWKTLEARLSLPLIEQLVEIILEKNGDLTLRPRTAEPKLILKPFHALDIPGAQSLQQDVERDFYMIVRDPDRGFSPFSPDTFDYALRACAARLSSKGQYLPDTAGAGVRPVDLPDPSDSLIVSDTWVIFVRPRQENYREEDINRLITCIENTEDESELPLSAIRFIELPSSKVEGPAIILGQDRIGGNSGNLVLPEEKTADAAFFFPLPYNDEQIEIIRRLETSDGVVVQGPPGTGKTHTIANIISHYMATGQRVLVTAKTAEALMALQEKLPPDINNLAISVVHSDREGAAHLQSAIRMLANEAKTVDVAKYVREIDDAESNLALLHNESLRLEEELQSIAIVNAKKISYRGHEYLPMDFAQVLNAEVPSHGWFPDILNFSTRYQDAFSDQDVAEIRRLRNLIGNDINHSATELIDPTTFPDIPAVLSAHAELQIGSTLKQKVVSGDIPYISTKIPDVIKRVQELSAWIDEFIPAFEKLKSEASLLSTYQKLIGTSKSEASELAELQRSMKNWSNLHARSKTIALKGILLSIEVDHTLERAISDLAKGKEVFGLFSLFKGGLKAKLDSISIEGRKPTKPQDWQAVEDYVFLEKDIVEFVGRWNSIAPAISCNPLPVTSAEARGDFLRLGAIISNVVSFANEYAQRSQSIIELFPYGIQVDRVLSDGDCHTLKKALDFYMKQSGTTTSIELQEAILGFAAGKSSRLCDALREFGKNLGEISVPEAAIADAWKQIIREATRLFAQKQNFERLQFLTDKISALAPNWANSLRWCEPKSGPDLTPEDWQLAWKWAQGRGFIETMPQRSDTQKIAERLNLIERQSKRLLLEIIKRRTFIGLKQRLSPKTLVALQQFIAAIGRLPKNSSSKSYSRYQRIIREAITQCSSAIPCWILPEWRVAEQLPADLASFDLVIVDEASQSNLLALTAVMRGKKVLIVGDDKQVSPEAVGTDDYSIVQLRHAYLEGLPFANQMDPMTSLYELGGMIYPGKTLMLREHFRCVEPIIRFSSQFYDQPLLPLRIPSNSERLDPPLIDIYLPHGKRNKSQKINKPEAEVIVDEIAKFVNDPRNSTRSIGVISLIGNDQSRMINSMLMEELGTEIVDRHKIVCGDSATFQGQERDIIYLSMVSCSETSTTLTARRYEQRFNVAMSRARDRVVLVRSVASSHLNKNDLKFRVIEHMKNPMGNGKVSRPTETMELCQSEFERDFARCMIGLGYRLHAQVPVAGYSIDFVIEGAENTRLAVELDGDKWHGPERWAQDIHRQKSLERLGWTFWRCWGSNWIADRDECLRDLITVLEKLKIDPIGGEPLPGIYTQHITIDPYVTPMGIDNSLNLESQSDIAEGLKENTSGEDLVEVGDLVVISYNDNPGKPERWHISKKPNDFERRILNEREPLAAILIGASKGDEIAVKLTDSERVAVIEFIGKSNFYSSESVVH